MTPTRSKRLTFLMLSGALALGALALTTAGQAAPPPITSENWTEQVGFPPNLEAAPVTPGKLVGKWNVGEVAKLLPEGLLRMVKKYELRLTLRAYEPVHPSQGYIEATNKYRGKAKIVEIGNEYRKQGLSGYVAGLPFPNPKNGLEVAWNYQYSYQGDDGDMYYDVYWISAPSGIEHTEYWRWAFLMRTLNRTDLDPKPAIPEFKSQGLQYTSITYAIEPYDKKGFGALYSRAEEPLDQQGHIYVPAMRRVLRNTFGTRGDTWNSTDLLYEDVRGYMGYPEWMNWKIVSKGTMLMPIHAGVKLGKNVRSTFEVDKWPHWNPKLQWEPRPVYVLDVTPKFPDYPYSRMRVVIDAETFTIPYKEAYDRKGQLWKVVLNAFNASEDMHSAPSPYAASVVVDLQAEHATLINIRKFEANSGLDPTMFTLSNLRKRGH